MRGAYPVNPGVVIAEVEVTPKDRDRRIVIGLRCWTALHSGRPAQQALGEQRLERLGEVKRERVPATTSPGPQEAYRRMPERTNFSTLLSASIGSFGHIRIITQFNAGCSKFH